MNFNIKQHPLISHLIPGFIFLLILYIASFDWKIMPLILDTEKVPSGNNLIIIGIISLVAAFLLGEVFDSLRDLIWENLWDKFLKKGIKWEFFFNGSIMDINKLQDGYFTWYVFNVNSSISIFFSLIIGFVWLDFSLIVLFIGIIIMTILVWDAIELRKEIVQHTTKNNEGNSL